MTWPPLWLKTPFTAGVASEKSNERELSVQTGETAGYPQVISRKSPPELTSG